MYQIQKMMKLKDDKLALQTGYVVSIREIDQIEIHFMLSSTKQYDYIYRNWFTTSVQVFMLLQNKIKKLLNFTAILLFCISALNARVRFIDLQAIHVFHQISFTI